MDAIQPVPRTLLRDRAYASIRDAIVSGEIEPGAVVRDADLAEQLGLSRAPVREAFARLVDAGLHADDELHDVLVRVSGNHAAAATITRYTPLIRRLERRRFGEGGNCRSAGLH